MVARFTTVTSMSRSLRNRSLSSFQLKRKRRDSKSFLMEQICMSGQETL
ncbi:hypothetical protein EVA_20509 [gut metagenome]|uniref:Uncharacterized protein n=1 Tax=gut metagenome TaxID=749906 RepID=J9FVH8_9ZZZZ